MNLFDVFKKTLETKMRCLIVLQEPTPTRKIIMRASLALKGNTLHSELGDKQNLI